MNEMMKKILCMMKKILCILILFAAVTLPIYLYFESSVDSHELQRLSIIQTQYPELDKKIKEYLSDGIVTRNEMFAIESYVEQLDRIDLMKRMNSRHPLKQLKEEMKKEIEDVGGRT